MPPGSARATDADAMPVDGPHRTVEHTRPGEEPGVPSGHGAPRGDSGGGPIKPASRTGRGRTSALSGAGVTDNPDALDRLRRRTERLERELSEIRALLGELERRGPTTSMPAAAPQADLGAGADGGPSVTRDSPPAEKLTLFRARFRGRDDVYALPWESRRTGKKGWSPAVQGGFATADVDDRELLPLTHGVIEHHLLGGSAAAGSSHVGLYPLMLDDRTHLLACDFDGGGWRKDAAAFAAACRDAGIDALAEISRSGNGAHVWIFFENAVPAVSARALGAALLRAAMSTRATISMQSYDRFFPSQDTLPQRSPGRLRLGNLIALPLQGDHRRRGTTVFADPATWEPVRDQFAALARTRPVPVAILDERVLPPRPSMGPREVLTARPLRSALRGLALGHPITVRCDALVHVPTDGLPGAVITTLKHVASVSNPEFYRRQAQRFSTFGVPRLVTCFEHGEAELRLPRGLLDETVSLLSESGFDVDVEHGTDAPRIDAPGFKGALRPEQAEAVSTLLQHDAGVLVAPPGSGKTVIACALIAERATPTAILVNRAELLEQWRTRLSEFLAIDEKQIGQLGNGRHKRRGRIDLIMMQSISHRGGDPGVLDEYGQIIVDECHAIAAPAMEAAIRQVSVRHWVGLTATPYRADQMGGLMTMQCGPVRYEIAAEASTERRLVVHPTVFTTEESGTDGSSIQAIYTELATDGSRNALIVEQVLSAVADERRCLVLTNRLEHLQVLASSIGERSDVPVLTMHGRLRAPDRRALRLRIGELDAARTPFVLLAIDKVAGEGIDLPSLNTLFLAMPVSFKGRVVQQIGRVTRGDEIGDAVATVHDFRDVEVPLLERMHQRRRRVMVKEGFRPSL